MTKELTNVQIADRLKVDVKTIRSYQKSNSPPSTLKRDHDWVTRLNPYDELWPEIEALLDVQPDLQAITIFDHLQRTYPGKFQDGQKRTLERKVRKWRALNGPTKEVYFDQTHRPGELGASDFSHMTECDVTIEGSPFPHMIYHFVLTYSNWESMMVCATETFDNLAEGFQKAMWELNGAPTSHQTDRLSAAVKNLKGDLSEFTDSYESLMKHYRMDFEKIQAGKGSVGIRPEDVTFVSKDHQTSNPVIKAKVDIVERLGDEQLVYATTGDNTFICKLDSHILVEYDQDAYFELNREKIHVFNTEDDNVTDFKKR